MSMTTSIWRARLRHPASWVSVIALVFLGTVGYRGLSLASHEQLVASHRLASTLSQGATFAALSESLTSPHPHIDLICALWLRLIPMEHAAALALLSALAMCVCLATLWRIISRHTQGNAWAACVGCATFLFLPGHVAQLGSPSATLITCAFFLLTWELCTRDKPRWWHAMLSWITGALLLGSWSPMLLWACVLLVAHLTYRARPDASHSGLIGRSSLPAGVLLCIPMVPLLATIIHPGFWPNFSQGWLSSLEAGWITSAPKGSSVAGHWYGQGKVPWVTTCAQLIAHIPLVTLLLSLPGVLWLVQTGRTVHHRLLLMSLPAMTLIVWATPGFDYGRVAQHVLWSALVCMLVGHGVAWCMAQSISQKWHKAIFPTLCAMAILTALVPTLAFWSTPATWQSSITGGAIHAQAQGNEHSRHLIVPRSQLEDTAIAHGITTIHAGDLNPILRAYDLPGVHVSESFDAQTSRLDFTPRFTPDALNKPLVMTAKRRLVFLGRPAAPAFYLALPEAQ